MLLENSIVIPWKNPPHWLIITSSLAEFTRLLISVQSSMQEWLDNGISCQGVDVFLYLTCHIIKITFRKFVVYLQFNIKFRRIYYYTVYVMFLMLMNSVDIQVHWGFKIPVNSIIDEYDGISPQSCALNHSYSMLHLIFLNNTHSKRLW